MYGHLNGLTPKSLYACVRVRDSLCRSIRIRTWYLQPFPSIFPTPSHPPSDSLVLLPVRAPPPPLHPFPADEPTPGSVAIEAAIMSTMQAAGTWIEIEPPQGTGVSPMTVHVWESPPGGHVPLFIVTLVNIPDMLFIPDHWFGFW